MFERFMCDFVYHQDHRIEMTEVIVTDRWEAYEWLEETFLELHRERSTAPDLLRLRTGDVTLGTLQSLFEVEGEGKHCALQTRRLEIHDVLS